MKLRIVVACVSIIVVASPLLAKGPSVKLQGPFTSFPFDEFNVETQSFIPGLGDRNFQIIVPAGKTLDQVEMVDGGLRRDRIILDKEGVSTDYTIAPTQDGFFLFEGCGVSHFNRSGSKRNWATLLSEQFSDLRVDGQARSLPNGSAVAMFSHTSKGNQDDAQLLRFRTESAKKEILLTLPKQGPDGVLGRIELPGGFIATWSQPREVGGERAQFYGFDGKPQNHPLAAAVNLLHQSKIDLKSAGLLPEFGALYPSQTKDAWALFPWKELPGYLGKSLFLLSVTDTVQAAPVTCERHSLEPNFSLRFVLVHPRLNLFLLGVRLDPKDRNVELYLGRVQKSDHVFRATTYKVHPFPEVASPVFSRDGNALLFAAKMDGQAQLVFAELPDILADINRRYPDAKLDLDSLKAEVK
jgi:hypothetical protein